MRRRRVVSPAALPLAGASGGNGSEPEREQLSTVPTAFLAAVKLVTRDAQWGITGQTRLMLAAQLPGCTAETIRELLADGEDAAATDSGGHTALMWAALRPSAEVVGALLKAPGASVAARNKDGSTALHLAALACGKAGAEAEAVQVLRLLLAAGADVLAADDKGFTPLMVASMHDSVEAMQLLLAAGADVAAATIFGGTALHNAAEAGAIGVVTQLLAAGANPVAVDSRGVGPMYIAAGLGHKEVLRALMAADRERRPAEDPAKVEALMAKAGATAMLEQRTKAKAEGFEFKVGSFWLGTHLRAPLLMCEAACDSAPQHTCLPAKLARLADHPPAVCAVRCRRCTAHRTCTLPRCGSFRLQTSGCLVTHGTGA